MIRDNIVTCTVIPHHTKQLLNMCVPQYREHYVQYRVLINTFSAGTDLFWRLQKIKWNESGLRPLLCTYRLNWARRTYWGWWDDTAVQTQDSKFEPWRSEAEHATSRSPRLPTILSYTSGWGRNILISFKPPRPGNEPRTLAWKAAVITTTLGPPPFDVWSQSPLWKSEIYTMTVDSQQRYLNEAEIVTSRILDVL